MPKGKYCCDILWVNSSDTRFISKEMRPGDVWTSSSLSFTHGMHFYANTVLLNMLPVHTGNNVCCHQTPPKHEISTHEEMLVVKCFKSLCSHNTQGARTSNPNNGICVSLLEPGDCNSLMWFWQRAVPLVSIWIHQLSTRQILDGKKQVRWFRCIVNCVLVNDKVMLT